MSVNAFLSYSRRDQHLVKPIVSFMRATDDVVFHDVDTIEPGKKWGPQIEKALGDSQMVVVCWCRHSARSKWVRKEYEQAIDAGKMVLPLLIDGTRLPDTLSEYQAIDWRHLAGSSHPPLSRYLLVLAGSVALFALGAAIGYGGRPLVKGPETVAVVVPGPSSGQEIVLPPPPPPPRTPTDSAEPRRPRPADTRAREGQPGAESAAGSAADTVAVALGTVAALVLAAVAAGLVAIRRRAHRAQEHAYEAQERAAAQLREAVRRSRERASGAADA